MTQQGRILKGQNGLYTVESGGEACKCRASSKLHKSKLKLLSGDIVEFCKNEDGSGFITSLCPRKNCLHRPPVANADLLAIVVSVTSPLPSIETIDKLTAIAVYNKLSVLIVITKSDLADTSELCDIYSKTPFDVICVSAEQNIGINELKAALIGKVSVLCGASGTGKSTLLRKLYPQTNAVGGSLSQKIMRGRNTTRVTELYHTDKDTYITDTPGFSMLELATCADIPVNELIECFPESLPYLGLCRYTKCSHTVEDGCAVLKAVAEGVISKSRHDNFVMLYHELKNINKYK